MAKVIIVDENDNPMGLKERDTWEDGEIHRSTALWISNSKGEILLAQRSLMKKHAPGKWGPAAAGTVEENETYESNVLKEAEEEIGITINLTQLEIGPKELVGASHNRRLRQWFMIRLDIPLESLKLQEVEVSAVRWIHWSELEKEILTTPDDFVGTNQLSFPTLIEWTKRSNLTA